MLCLLSYFILVLFYLINMGSLQYITSSKHQKDQKSLGLDSSQCSHKFAYGKSELKCIIIFFFIIEIETICCGLSEQMLHRGQFYLQTSVDAGSCLAAVFRKTNSFSKPPVNLFFCKLLICGWFQVKARDDGAVAR